MPIKKQKDIITFKDISFSYENKNILEDISFGIAEGDYVGLIGPNGSGKTTLLKLLLGLLKPSRGSIHLFGKPAHLFKQRSIIGYVPQRTGQKDFYFPATVEEIVRSGRTAHLGTLGKFSKKDRDAVDEAMEVANMSQYKDALIGSLSGGERQRVFIARALAAEPRILILDEPEAGVDISVQDKFYKFINHLNTKYNLTIILVSHNIDIIAKEVKSVICLNHRLICHGSIKDFIKEEYLQQLYGKSTKFLEHHHTDTNH